MKAAVLVEQNKPLEIMDVSHCSDVVQPPSWLAGVRIGQVKVKVHFAGICGAQIGEINGAAGEDKFLPHLMGHEGGGVVDKIGAGVTTVAVGDHVVLHWRKGEGIESDFPKYIKGKEYSTSGQEIGAGKVACWSEYAIVSENRCTKIDKDFPLDLAALMGCSVTTGFGLINNEAELKLGETILVIGCGGVGLNIIQGARLAGAGRIVGCDNVERRAKAAQIFGANFGVVSINQIRMNDITFDVVVDCTGLSDVIDAGLDRVKPGGKMILVGQPHYQRELHLRGFRELYRGITIMDSQGGMTNPAVDIPRYIAMWKLGDLNFDNHITHRFNLDEINDAIVCHMSGEANKVIIKM